MEEESNRVWGLQEGLLGGDGSFRKLETLLGGSWIVISGVIR